MTIRTSSTDPLRIATVATPVGGLIGMTICPGKHDSWGLTGAWQRSLSEDMLSIVDWGASTVVTLVEQRELEQLGVPDLGRCVEEAGLQWHHLPIRDVSIPDRAFEGRWDAAGAQIRERLAEGQRVVVHCRGGLGRTGTITARLLIEFGVTPREALAQVRAARPGAVETLEQELYVMGFSPPGDASQQAL